MLSHWFTQLSDRNPQLLREIKGRINRRNVLVTVAVSLVLQVLLVGHYRRDIDSTFKHNVVIAHNGWFQIFDTVTWVAMLALLFLCSYLLVKDITKEEKRGTLDSVRLSPASAQSVLVGKLLGVPILVYLAIALALPLHLWAAIHARLSLSTPVSVYLLVVTSYGFISSFAMLHSMSWGAKAQVWYVIPIACITAFLLYALKVSANYQYQVAVAQATIATEALKPEKPLLGIIRFFVIVFVGLGLSLWWMCIHRFHHPPLRR